MQTRDVPHVYMLCSLQHLLPSMSSPPPATCHSLRLHTRGWEELSAFPVWSLLSCTPACWPLTPYLLVVHFHARFSILCVTALICPHLSVPAAVTSVQATTISTCLLTTTSPLISPPLIPLPNDLFSAPHSL